MNKTSANPGDSEQPSFEVALEQLEGLVRRLEEGDLGLNEALGAYEQGVKLLRQCYDLLQKAERRIELLSGADPQGKPMTTPLEDSALSLEEKAQQRSRRRSARRAAPPAEGSQGECQQNDMDVPGGLF